MRMLAGVVDAIIGDRDGRLTVKRSCMRSNGWSSTPATTTSRTSPPSRTTPPAGHLQQLRRAEEGLHPEIPTPTTIPGSSNWHPTRISASRSAKTGAIWRLRLSSSGDGRSSGFTWQIWSTGPRRPSTAGMPTGVRLATADAEADHASLRARGVDTDPQIMRGEPQRHHRGGQPAGGLWRCAAHAGRR